MPVKQIEGQERSMTLVEMVCLDVKAERAQQPDAAQA